MRAHKRLRAPFFAALDFETANNDRHTACALGVAIARKDEIVAVERFLIRPPTRDFRFSHIHGLTWNDVAEAPTFAEIWEGIFPILEKATFFAAHNAAFDRAVLESCCSYYGLPIPSKEFLCTVKLARQIFDIYPTKLPNVCKRLHIPLHHHEAGSDALACAHIVLAALPHFTSL